MLRHLAYYDYLASMEETTRAWTVTLAGLGVLALIDAAREDKTLIDADWTGLRSLSELIGSIREGDPVRRTLVRVVDDLRGAGPNWSRVNQSLFAYGRALDFDGSWTLAVDVFDTVAEIARTERDPQLAIDATTALGGSARRSGDWDRSAEGYSEAAYLADALGDKASGLTVRVGTANTHIARGNLPAAQLILDEVIAEAAKSGLDGVSALAQHGSASIAHLQERYADAVTLAYKALEKATNPTVRDNIMADLAAALYHMGLHDAARDAYLITSMTSRYQWVRWQATINLMEMASTDSDTGAFDQYGRELKHAALDPRLRAYFLLYYGEGCARLGRHDEAERSLDEAVRFATDHKIYQVAHDAERELAKGEKIARAEAAKVQSGVPVPAEIAHVVTAISALREAAETSPPIDEWL